MTMPAEDLPEKLPVPASLTPMEMLSEAIKQGQTIEVLSKLMDLQERVERNQARREYDNAIAAAKAEIPPIPKNRLGHNGRKYADLAGIAKTIDPIITKYGLSYRYRTAQLNPGSIQVTCIISHRAGYSEEHPLIGPPDTSGSKNMLQSIGSTLTYLQRYGIMQGLGLAADDDDDGEGGAQVVRMPPPRPAPNVMRTVENPPPDEGPAAEAPAPETSGSGVGAIDRRLHDAARQGMQTLALEWTKLVEGEWPNLLPDERAGLRKALEDRHKPTAAAADANALDP